MVGPYHWWAHGVISRRRFALSPHKPTKTMTPKQSTARLSIYVLIAMTAAASAGALTVDFNDGRQVTVFILAIVMAGLNTARSYIDTSDSQVPRP